MGLHLLANQSIVSHFLVKKDEVSENIELIFRIDAGFELHPV